MIDTTVPLERTINNFLNTMNKLSLLIAILFAGLNTLAQQKFTIGGTLKSKRTGETIIGGSIRSNNVGTVSNEYGFYSLTLPQGTHTLEFSSVGLLTQTMQVDLTKNSTINILLDDLTKDLDEVIVTAAPRGRSLKSTQMGVEQISTKEIKNIPMLLGERDVLKAIQLLPGIKSAGEGNSGFFVRGGAADQNLILLDEAPVYNASHLLGFFFHFQLRRY